MNIAFFLTPKTDIIFETPKSTMRQALERMEYHRYTAIPVIDENGKYVDTITEGDLLWKLKSLPEISLSETENILLEDIPKHMVNKTVSINADIEDLINLATSQNFVPVIDDKDIFIGIIKRSDIINYCYNQYVKKDHKVKE
ncbi:CBS domain-containing protein [Proteinivorax hydrogeniformans]|uniref:CBS domain-containing protein n=1 Tax=Proteinivorax hydrogeniformans TaxID=1826727 RepID=A0AAU8HTT5_9FIRM